VKLGGRDVVALALAELSTLLLYTLNDVQPQRPLSTAVQRKLLGGLADPIVKSGLEALGWVVDERGLGGGREMDGLSWQLPLDELWESYVEAEVRREAALIGGDVRVGRRGETVFPVVWSRRGAGSMSHLIPDIVVRRGRAVHIIDAKYKAHFAELNVSGWRGVTEEAKESHRADLHQVLAYSALFDADEITATLLYPLRWETWEEMEADNRHAAVADLIHGGRRIRLELRGLPFGRPKAA
jgi:5-methylcytosine-specific restriction endonuclease McrBC regulatory subunit McrC